MEDYASHTLKSASFSTPVTLVGFDTLPEVGAEFQTFKNKREAETARGEITTAREIPTVGVSSASRYLLPVIVRADASGSLEAIAHEIVKIGDEHAGVSIVLSGIGNISENDVKTAMAGSTQALLIGFNVTIDPVAEALARQHAVPIETFAIIYKLTEHLEERLAALKPSRTVEVVSGVARILRRFSSQHNVHVVGGSVSEGILEVHKDVRINRRKIMIGKGEIINIQINKQNASKVEAGNEFGAQIEATFEIAEGDTLEYITTKKE